MNKKILAIFAMTAMIGVLGCGSSDNDSVNPSKYVTLGEFEGIKVEKVVTKITDEEIETALSDELNSYVEYASMYEYDEITDRTEVADGDVANIDYVGLLDGEAFEGGTAEGTNLKIGSNSFIPGFETGLIGHSVGEEVSLNLTFPENYSSTDLAGKAVVFNVKINGIYDAETQRVPEFNDEFIKKLSALAGTEFATMDEYKADLKSYLEQQASASDETSNQKAIWDAVYATCEVKDPPANMVDSLKQRVYDNAQSYATQYGVTLAEFITSNMGMTEEDFEKQASEAALHSAKENLAMQAIAKKAGLQVSKKEIQDTSAAEATTYGYETAEAYIEASGGAETFEQYLLSKKVYEYLESVVEIVEVEKSSSDKAAADGNEAADENEAAADENEAAADESGSDTE